MNILHLPENQLDEDESWRCRVCGGSFYSDLDEDEDEICNQCLDFDG